MEKETKKYEIGYLLSPLIPEEKLDEEIFILRKAIEDRQCLITGEERARTRKLAYSVKKPALGSFDTAYFGWIKFIAEPETLREIDITLGKEPNIIRFLITESAREDLSKKAAKRAVRKKRISGAEPKIKTEVKPEEIDKKLEELLGS